MRRITRLITWFSLGFYGGALIFETDLEVLKTKSIFFLICIFVAAVLNVIDEIKNN